MSETAIPAKSNDVEPWLRGTLTDVPAVHRAVLHALAQAREDVERWCATFTDAQWHAQPHHLPSAAFHVRHIAQSMDRLLSYAEARELSATQHAALKSEAEARPTGAEILREFRAAMDDAEQRVRAFIGSDLEAPRAVGRKRLPTTLGGLLVHLAEHTQRHVGSLIVLARIVRG